MKRSLLLCSMILWIPLQAFSQKDTQGTINLPFQMAKLVALDLVELDRLKEVEILNALILEKYKLSLVKSQQMGSNKSLQILLLKNTLELTEAQLKARKETKGNLFNKIMIFLGLFAAGYIVGSS